MWKLFFEKEFITDPGQIWTAGFGICYRSDFVKQLKKFIQIYLRNAYQIAKS